jgi:hypothetical protein
MTKFKTTANLEDETQRSITLEKDFGSTLDESVELFGEEVVHSVFVAQAKVKAQSFVRSKLESGATDDEIQAALDEWKLGVVKRSGKTKEEKALDAIQKLSPEEKAELIARLEAEE